MALLLSIDAGTTSVKAGLFTPEGKCLGVERFEYQLETPAPDRVELDPEIYWQACKQVVRQVMQCTRVSPKEVLAVTISSQGETTIAVDRQGAPLHPAIVWLDNRAVQEARELDEQIGALAYDHTGLPDITPTWTACKILWLKQHKPETFANVHKFLLVQDWLVYRMSGRYVTDGSVSCTSLLYDINTHHWWPAVLDAIGLEADRLPEIGAPGSVAGELSQAAAGELGLAASTPVVLGGMDQAVGALGAGNIRPGVISETTGAAMVMQVSVPRADVDRSRRIPVGQHSAPGVYLLEPVIPTAGMAFKWFRDVFGETELAAAKAGGRDAYDLLTEQAAAVPPGADGLLMLPHLTGSLNPTFNSEARGVFSGFTMAHHKGHFVRAILESVAFMLRRNLDIAVAAGIRGQEIRSSGGGARSRLWNQIKADVCGLPVVSLASEEAALLGDAILGGVAVNLFESLAEGTRRMVAFVDRIEPGPDQAAYQRLYQRFCDLDDTLDPFFRRA